MTLLEALTAAVDSVVGGIVASFESGHSLLIDERAFGVMLDKVNDLNREAITEAGGFSTEGDDVDFMFDTSSSFLTPWQHFVGTARNHIFDVITDNEGLTFGEDLERALRSGVLSAEGLEAFVARETVALAQGAQWARAFADGEELTWNTILDDRTRDEHAASPPNGQTIRPADDELFDVDGHQARFPLDPNLPVGLRINCRCFVESSTEASTTATGLRAERKEPAMADTIIEPATDEADSNTLTTGGGPVVTGTLDNVTIDTAELAKQVAAELNQTAEFAEIKDAADGTGPDEDYEWSGPIVYQGITTGDGRIIDNDALAWRDLPITLMASFQNMGGHYGSVPAGKITRLEPRTDGSIWGYGFFDSGANGQEAKRMLKEQTMRGISVDLSDVEYSYDFEEGLFRIHKAKIMAATVTPMPAFEKAIIDVHKGDEALAAAGALRSISVSFGMPVQATEDGWRTVPVEEVPGLVASGGKVRSISPWDLKPDPEVFACKNTTEPFRVDENGVLSGLVTTWDAVHLSFIGQRIHPPRSKTNYAMLHEPGTVLCSDGSVVSVGRVFGDMDHVPTDEYIPPADVAAAYADTGKLLAGARFYDTEHGIEVAGIMAPGTTEEDAARLRMCDISPDWRPMESLPYGDNLECVAMLAVNMSGFNLGLVASGEPKGNLKVSWDANGNIAAMTGLPVATPKATAEHAEMAELREMVDVLMADYTERRKAKAMAAFS